MVTARRRIKKARITHLSLCPRGKNRLPVLFKSDDETGNLEVEFQTILKSNEEEGTITAIVWPAEMPDSVGDIASAEVVKEMSYGFMRELASGKGGLDIRHNLETIDPEDAFIAESFIIQKGDPRFAGILDRDNAPIDPTGAWATVIKLDSEELRAEYRSGKWDGISMYGQALVEPVAKTDFDLEMVASRVFDAMGDRLARKIRDGEIDVDEKKLLDLLAARDTTLLATIKKEVTDIVAAGATAAATASPGVTTAPVVAAVPAVAPVVKSEPEGIEVVAPILKSADIGNSEKLAQYQSELHRYKLAKMVNWDDPKSIGEYQEALAKLEHDAAEDAKVKGEKKGKLDKDGKPVIAKKSEPARSTQGDDPDEETVQLRKEEHTAASRMARAAGVITGVGSFADKTD